jgi:hypothetical protein
MFGFHRDPVYCPYRTDAARTIQRSPSALHWILVTAEQQLNQHAPEPTKSVTIGQSILKRRANGYSILRSLLNNPNFDLEEAVITLRFAISAECYIFNADACGEHLKALDSLLQQPGILNFFATNMDKTPLSLSALKRVYANAPMRIKPVSEFEAVRTMVFLNLRRLQMLSKQNHAELVRHATTAYLLQTEDSPSADSASSQIESTAVAHETLLGRYISVKKSALFSTFATQTMNSTCDPKSKYSYQAGLFGLFYCLNMTLASFGKQNFADKIMFLQRLKSVLDGSSERSLGASAILAVVDRVREQYYSECFAKDEVVLKEVDLFTYEINALKIFSLLDGETRIQLTAAVRAWLLSDISMDPSLEQESLGDDDIVTMEEKATTLWWKQHLSSKASCSPILSPNP